MDPPDKQVHAAAATRTTLSDQSLLLALLTLDKHPEEGGEVEVADEDGGRAVGRDAALASPAVLAGGGVAAVATAGIGLENIMEVKRACAQVRAKSS